MEADIVFANRNSRETGWDFTLGKECEGVEWLKEGGTEMIKSTMLFFQLKWGLRLLC